MRFLITGMAGFIGSHLADRLAADGHTIVGVDNLTTGSPDNTVDELHVIDITDRHALYEIANYHEPDVVIHCAASYSDPNLWHRDTDTNITGTINATLVAKHHDARLIYFQTALPPISSYAISKIAGEQYIKLSHVPALIFRLANIYGPRNLSGPIPTFYKRLTAGEPCTVTNTRRDTVYIDDLINLVTAAIDKQASGKFDVCSGTAYPIRRYYDAVANTLGNTATPQMVERAADDIAEMELSAILAGYEFGWIATTSLEAGIAQTIDWYRQHGVAETYTHLQLTKAG